MDVRVRRIYDEVARSDGRRVLVDRLWPRGVAKADVELERWAREVAPSDELRRWYDHDPERWDDFRERYRTELESDERREALEDLAATDGRVTLLTATKDVDRSHAVVLAEVLRELGGPRGADRPGT